MRPFDFLKKRIVLPASGHKKSHAGFTLLELLISLLLLSISFMAIIPLLMNTMNLSRKTDMGSIARDLATQKVEELMTQPYEVLSATLGTSAIEYVTSKGVVSVVSDPAAIYLRTWDVRFVPNTTASPRPVTLTAVVRFAPKGNIKTMALTDPAVKSRSFSTMWSF